MHFDMKKTLFKTIALAMTIPQLLAGTVSADPTATAAALPASAASASSATAPQAPVVSTPIYLEAYVPLDAPKGKVLSANAVKVKKVYVLIKDGAIDTVSDKKLNEESIPTNAIQITEKKSGRLLLSPGFIDMHNHLDHNVLPLWTGAHGQFNNRFVWRDVPDYEDNVRGVIKKIKAGATKFAPDSNFCKIIQYAEMKALLGGVTTIQGIGGPTNIDCGFGKLIRNVENENDFDIKTDARVTFEVINPKHGKILQDHLIPLAQSKGVSLLEAYKSLPADITKQEIYSYTDALFSGLTKQQAIFENIAPKGTAVNRAFITHLAEGKSADPFTKTEFKLARALGFARHGLVVIHGIGLDAQEWIQAAKENVSLVWSPFSNLLLYGETTDIKAAKEAGINISMGSDWSPSGSKTLLDEVRIAKQFLGINKQSALLTDKDFYQMLTINAAKALKLDDRLGKIEKGYLADIVAVPLVSSRANPYTTIVDSDSSDIRLVILNGKIVIANKNWTQPTDETEEIMADAQPECIGFRGQVLVNVKPGLKELVDVLSQIVQPVLDGYASCSDHLYLSKIENLFNNDYKPESKGKIDPPKINENFEKLNRMLNDVLSTNSTLK